MLIFFPGPCNFALENDVPIADSGYPLFNNHLSSSFNQSANFCLSDINTEIRFTKLEGMLCFMWLE